MKKTLTVAAIAAALVLAGCSKNEPQAVSEPVIPSASTTSAAPTSEVSPSTKAAPTTTAVTTTKRARGVLEPSEIGVSKTYGIETSILSVATEQSSSYGPLTVFTIQLNNASDEVFQGYNFLTPTLTYGEAGLPADVQFSGADGFGDGVQGSIPPGSRQTVKYAYKVDIAELNPAVLTIGSLVWKGDFTAFSR
ncbi:hypothetical protein [Rhodococcus qingshengii]|uniref:hypothetical protein n=1 Tax=Rhodococcus qingshengii TaxID=334542 RepID=UPI001C604F85|nr:hypothetical protein [Rhodococcus qingshengii]MBW4813373.1 hypothetical protein [Rhodococcus qingshengii]